MNIIEGSYLKKKKKKKKKKAIPLQAWTGPEGFLRVSGG